MTQLRKRIRKVSTAVFRGSRSEYNFDVYPISTAITDHPVVYIFSRRKIDKGGRAHHAVSCVGETQSIVSEIKKHKRARCVKGNEANVVCIFKEGDRKLRSTVLDDIASAREFSCIQGKFKPTIKAKPDAVKNGKSVKILSFKQPDKNGDRPGSVIAAKHPADSKPGKRSTAQKKTELSPKQKISDPRTDKKRATPESGKRVSSRVDSDGGQHRFSKPKRSVARGTKTRIAGGSGSRKRLAA